LLGKLKLNQAKLLLPKIIGCLENIMNNGDEFVSRKKKLRHALFADLFVNGKDSKKVTKKGSFIDILPMDRKKSFNNKNN